MPYRALLSSPAFVADLADAGYLAYDNGRFHLTPAGKATLDAFPSEHDKSPNYTTRGNTHHPTHLGALALLGEVAAGGKA